MRTRFVLLFISVLVILGAGALTFPTPAVADGDHLNQLPNPTGVSIACPDFQNVLWSADSVQSAQVGGYSGSGVVHCDKILFSPKTRITCPSEAVEPYSELAGPATFENFGRSDQLDIKVLDNPQKVADVRAKVVLFLKELNCIRANGNQIQKSNIKVLDVEYVVFQPPTGIVTCSPGWDQPCTIE